MEQENRSFVHDTIDLDEIRGLLGDSPSALRNLSAQDEDVDIADKNVVPGEEQKNVPSEEFARPESKEKKGMALELYSMLHDLVYILAVVTLLFVFVVRLVGVEGDSMLPTLHNGDFLLLESNFLYGIDDIENGDIVVLNEPYHWKRDHSLIVKRVIATEGQTVDFDFDRHEVYVDGILLQEDYINSPTVAIWDGEYALDYPVTVPEGHIFVLGDNRGNSSDSRYAPVGMIDVRCVLGKAVAVAMPGQTRDMFGNVIEKRDWSRIGLVS